MFLLDRKNTAYDFFYSKQEQLNNKIKKLHFIAKIFK